MIVDRKIHPMQKIINYMYEKEMRPLELLRSFDKEGNFVVTEDDFIERLKVSEIHYIYFYYMFIVVVVCL